LPTRRSSDLVIETAAASQACGTQGFDLAGKAEGTRSGDRLDVGIFLEIHLGEIRSGVDGRMLEVDGERQCKAVIWLESRPFSVLALALADFHGLQYAQKLLGCCLFLQP